MATIDDVAKASGVSKGTVSNVFSKKRPISKAVSERVLAAARELNYKPNYWARSLANRSTRIIGLNMMGDSSKFSQFHLSLLNGVLRVCYEHGYRLLVNTLSPEYLSQVENMASDPVDGEILLDPAERDTRVEERVARSAPLVIIGRPPVYYEAQVSYVDNDNAGMASEVTRYLLTLEHRNILFLNAAAGRTVAGDRELGYKSAFRSKGLTPDPRMMLHIPVPGPASYEFGYQTALAMLKEFPSITAVIADTDTMALGVYKAAEKLNLRIPEELSVFAFSDDSVFSPQFSPPLTGVRLHSEQLGLEAARLLVEQLKVPSKTAKRVLVPTELVIRGSCTPKSYSM
ncbi:LacI family DNA-binding transcriptional regulator [Paenibacillus nasutitermitis]|uniref:LacI family transcriptional regulator n=1 Tax=Paenibacillus nasutitermitis TaxID=1652958 RepID=A0A917E2A2_9BACL|nr:LacI family DNA-binding transcriptional regulator [Paenibacillus nasutitermitis]GGD95823.1 LacI family transcriptional regulator [Paenibacillus nasutitermitis]